ncbi:hypothetical protein DASC09_009550 [Saccharomycopsis crataegensis]|uniref:Uncharacterized protein n=1 Tax=Saccharomycopsis crataegensis TaxID=43959 RepID=A0AAV5QGQ0_9ASCO|nr:hypothetical protein DASC09_009550 [Saccharomycopsis crataegensis]
MDYPNATSTQSQPHFSSYENSVSKTHRGQTFDEETQSPENNNNNSIHQHLSHDLVLSDSEEVDEFIHKYGHVEFQYIKKPQDSFWFVRPHALNYFKDGVLYRTKGERTSGKTELFLDLMYVGIVANLASDATEHASAASFLKYMLLFIPSWTVWSDIKDFVNYYYSEDLSQKLYLLWILILLLVYDNNCTYVLDGRGEAALTVVPYMLCRLSLAISLLFYSIFIPEHRLQMRVYGCTIIVFCCVWISVIFIDTRAKIGVSIAIMFLEHSTFCLIYHPWFKKNVLHLTCSTALNIEHEVERFGAFFIIAIGEFLYKTVAGNPVGAGFQGKLSRGICLLIISYCFLWLYFNSGTSVKATHPLRRSGAAAICWIYSHIPLIAGLILAADSAGEWITLENTSTAKHPSHEESSTTETVLKFLFRRAAESSSESSSSSSEETEEPSMYALSFFFTGGLCAALWALTIMGFAEKSRDPWNTHVVTKFWRIAPRFPAGVIILCMSFAEMSTTHLLGFTAMICVILWLWESVTMTPRANLPPVLGGHCDITPSDIIERF